MTSRLPAGEAGHAGGQGRITGPCESRSRSKLFKSLKLEGVKKSCRLNEPGASFSMDSLNEVLPSKSPLLVAAYRFPLASKAGAAPDCQNAPWLPLGVALNTALC